MKLNFKQYGSGHPLIILHGLMGSLDNWGTLAKRFGEYFSVYIVDQRNHGQSPHDDDIDYELMSEDLLEFIEDHDLVRPILLGHSMGGKTVMKFALDNPDKVSALIVADISPRTYKVHHDQILDALASINFYEVKSRKEVENILLDKLGDKGTVLFLAKNVYWESKEKLAYRFNLESLRNNITTISAWPENHMVYNGDVLFLRGGKSNYIGDHETSIEEQFPKAALQTIEGAGHWLHAEKPDEFFNHVMNYLDAQGLKP
jgi:esterase